MRFEITVGQIGREGTVEIDDVDISNRVRYVAVSAGVDIPTTLQLTQYPDEGGVIRGVSGHVVHQCVRCGDIEVELVDTDDDEIIRVPVDDEFLDRIRNASSIEEEVDE